MKVMVTGASGLIGSALVPVLESSGNEVVQLTRSPARRAGEYRWDPAQGYIDAGALDGVDAVVHLAGETVAGRWTDAKKRRIMDSRVQGTRLVSEAIAGLDRKPAVLVSASGIGVYGERGDEPRTEEGALGDGFLADVVRVGGRRRSGPRCGDQGRAHALRHRAEPPGRRAAGPAPSVQAGPRRAGRRRAAVRELGRDRRCRGRDPFALSRTTSPVR